MGWLADSKERLMGGRRAPHGLVGEGRVREEGEDKDAERRKEQQEERLRKAGLRAGKRRTKMKSMKSRDQKEGHR